MFLCASGVFLAVPTSSCNSLNEILPGCVCKGNDSGPKTEVCLDKTVMIPSPLGT